MAVSTDIKAQEVEDKLRPYVIGAALAVLPLLALSLTHPHGIWHTVEVVGHWAIWLVFFTEVVIMLTVSQDKRGWAAGHRFELIVVALSSPLIPLALAAAPAVRLLILAKLFKSLKLAKVIKLTKLAKSFKLLRKKLGLVGAPFAALMALTGLIACGMVAYIITGHSGASLFGETAVLAICGLLLSLVLGQIPITRKSAKSPATVNSTSG